MFFSGQLTMAAVYPQKATTTIENEKTKSIEAAHFTRAAKKTWPSAEGRLEEIFFCLMCVELKDVVGLKPQIFVSLRQTIPSIRSSQKHVKTPIYRGSRHKLLLIDLNLL
jgi:hypothetical protein